MKFKFLEHTADIKFQAFGKNLEEVFENSALAVSNSMWDKKVKLSKQLKFKVSGKDIEALMYNFLEEFLYYFETQGFILGKVSKIKIKKNKSYALEVELKGDESKNYNIYTHIKAVTYNEMFIKKKAGKFIAQVVLDV